MDLRKALEEMTLEVRIDPLITFMEASAKIDPIDEQGENGHQSATFQHWWSIAGTTFMMLVLIEAAALL